MSILTVKNVSHSFGGRTILKNVSFALNEGEHIGLIGPNGEGKSTFLKIVLKQLTPDEGTIEWAKRSRVGYLDQYTTLSQGKTIREVLQEAFEDMYALEAEMNDAYMKMGEVEGDELDKIMQDAGEISSYLEQSGFYLIDVKIEEVARGLGVSDFGLDKDVTALSGGQRSKVLLAKLLLQNPNILVLDEPTNFLDEYQVKWLKNYLMEFGNAFILISHDEAFLRDVINVVYHLEDATMNRYKGGYDFYLKNSEIKKRQAEDAYNAQQREIARMEGTIARNKARVATRGLASSLQKRLDRMEVIEKASEKIKPNFVFKMDNVNASKTVFSCKDLVIGYSFPLTRPINLEITRGEKIAIKGVNGIGKTTLLKSITGLIKPISGEVVVGSNAEIGYFQQEEECKDKTAFNEIYDEFPSLNIGQVMGALASCGLTKDNIDSYMIALSGGENAKVRLCKLTIQKSNILILDEPTNHLDVLAKESLKEAIQAYPGTVILVSHEEDFYRGVATRVINLEEYKI